MYKQQRLAISVLFAVLLPCLLSAENIHYWHVLHVLPNLKFDAEARYREELKHGLPASDRIGVKRSLEKTAAQLAKGVTVEGEYSIDIEPWGSYIEDVGPGFGEVQDVRTYKEFYNGDVTVLCHRPGPEIHEGDGRMLDAAPATQILLGGVTPSGGRLLSSGPRSEMLEFEHCYRGTWRADITYADAAHQRIKSIASYKKINGKLVYGKSYSVLDYAVIGGKERPFHITTTTYYQGQATENEELTLKNITAPVANDPNILLKKNDNVLDLRIGMQPEQQACYLWDGSLMDKSELATLAAQQHGAPVPQKGFNWNMAGYFALTFLTGSLLFRSARRRKALAA